jgi:hypothetical protein
MRAEASAASVPACPPPITITSNFLEYRMVCLNKGNDHIIFALFHVKQEHARSHEYNPNSLI